MPVDCTIIIRPICLPPLISRHICPPMKLYNEDLLILEYGYCYYLWMLKRLRKIAPVNLYQTFATKLCTGWGVHLHLDRAPASGYWQLCRSAGTQVQRKLPAVEFNQRTQFDRHLSSKWMMMIYHETDDYLNPPGHIGLGIWGHKPICPAWLLFFIRMALNPPQGLCN